MCVFCEIIAGNIPGSVVYEDEDIIAILDLSQVTRGHTLVMPKAHYENIYDCDPEVLRKLITVVQKLAGELTEKLHAQGCNILNNNNEVAGQSVMHLHFHIIPRYNEKDGFNPEFHPVEKHELSDVLAEIKG